jgi:hypothetical protein
MRSTFTNTLRGSLRVAHDSLGKSIEETQNPGQRVRLEVARAAVRNALGRVDVSDGAKAILASLDQILIGHLDATAARYIEIARIHCRAMTKEGALN